MTLILYLGSLAQSSEFSFLSENNSANNQAGFIENNGQILDINGQQRPDIFFQSVHSSPNSFYLKDKIAFVYSSRTGQEGLIDTIRKIEMTWKYSDAGLNSIPYSVEETDEKFNFYLPHCQSSQCVNIIKHNGLIYKNIYSGVDLKITKGEDFLSYYFITNEYTSADLINLNFTGIENLFIIENKIFLVFGNRVIILPSPTAYQIDSNNQKIMLPWQPRYQVTPDDNIKILSTGTFDPSKKLVYQISGSVLNKSTIEQRNLEWSTYFGGNSSFDEYWDIETDLYDNVYITGHAFSSNFPTTVGASQINLAGQDDIVICKFSKDLKLLWSTYHGGRESDGSSKHGITIDNTGNVYIAATTWSQDIPLLQINNNSFFDNLNSCQFSNRCRDLIIAKYNTNGNLQWSTYFGGNESMTSESDIFVDVNNNIFVTSKDGGIGMPFTIFTNGYNSTTNGAFIAMFNSNLNLQWCTGFGGSGVDPMSIIKANDGKLYIVGVASEDQLPTQSLANAYNQQFGGGEWDAFICRFNTNLGLEWSTYFGGNGLDWFKRVNADVDVNNFMITVIGNTNSTNFPTIINSVFTQNSYAGPNNPSTDGDLSIVQFNRNGVLIRSGFYGGGESEMGLGIATYFGQEYYAGNTKSVDFPLMNSSSQSNNFYYNNQFYNSGGGSMGFFLGFDNLKNRNWTTYYGGETNWNAFNGAIIHSLKCAYPYLYFTGVTSAISFFPSYSISGGYRSNSLSGGFIGRFRISNVPLGNDEISISNTDINQIIYPNPTNGSIKIKENEKLIKLNVYDLLGLLIISVDNPNSNIDLTSLQEGIYLIETIDTNGVSSFIKLSKNH